MQIRMLYLPYRLAAANPDATTIQPLAGEIQKLLTERGFYPGDPANPNNQEIRAALARFQDHEQLPVTGEIDPLTYCRLNPAQTNTLDTTAVKQRFKTTLARASILIDRAPRRLTLFNGNQAFRQYPVGIGKPATPTPVGNYAIAVKVMNPGGVLGSRWLGLNYDSYGIHGTNKPWLIGQMISLGCIRMHNAHVEELYALVAVGTPVFIRN